MGVRPVARASCRVLGADTGIVQLGSPVTKQGGVHLEGVSVYWGYYSSGGVGTFEVPLQNPFLGATATVGVAATVGGSKSGEKKAALHGVILHRTSALFTPSAVTTTAAR